MVWTADPGPEVLLEEIYRSPPSPVLVLRRGIPDQSWRKMTYFVQSGLILERR
jgi:hypothetical protein